MNIIYIVNVFPKISETFILNQITDLIGMGHEVSILAAYKSGEQVVHKDVYKYGLLERTHYLVRNKSSLGFELNKEIASLLFFTDVIHAHFAVLPSDFALSISKVFGIPFVITAHAYDIFIKPDISLLREKFDRAARVITISEFNKKYLLGMLGADLKDKIEVIKCGVRLEDFKYHERERNKIVKVLFTGRFVEKKGLLYAIKAFGETVKECENTELRIIGGGELKEQASELVLRLDLKKKVNFLGPLPQSEVKRELQAADIFLLPSVTAANGDMEGVPVSIMEAAATGLPVISSLHTGISEAVLDGKTGFLTPEKDICAITFRLKELINDQELRIKMGKEGRAHIEKNYDHKKEMTMLESVFGDLVDEKASIAGFSKEQMPLLEKRVCGIVSQFTNGIWKQNNNAMPFKERAVSFAQSNIIKKISFLKKISFKLFNSFQGEKGRL